MRSVKFVLLSLACAGALLAADTFVGTWKLNSAKTKYKTGMPPKEQMLTYTEEGGELHIMAKGTSSDGKTVTNHFTVPTSGGKAKIIESPYDGISVKNTSANQRETSFSKAGKVVYTAKSKLSADGKTMTIAVKGNNSFGQSVDGSNVYEKQ